MKTIIAGSREITDFALVERAVNESGFTITEVVSGRARGVDTLGEEWAKRHAVPVKEFSADWKQYGKSAGAIRNNQMRDYAECLVAVHMNKSRGTGHMIWTARQHGLKVYVLEVNALAEQNPTLF